jgi:hypothetical protein
LKDSLKQKLELQRVVTVASLLGAALLLERTLTVAEAAPAAGIKNVVLMHGAKQ